MRCSWCRNESITTKVSEMINDFVKKLLVIEDEESEKENLRKMDSVRELFDIARNTDDPVLHRRIISGVREVADSFLKDNDPIGYWILSHWYGFCGDYSNALVCNYIASKMGVSDSIVEIKKLEHEAEKNEYVSLALAETCFMSGADEEGMKWLKKTIDHGCKAGRLGLSLREKGNVVKIDAPQELPAVVSRLKLRLFSHVMVDYKKMDEDYYQKAVSFCKGVAFASGTEIRIDESEKKIWLSHGCKARVLKEITRDREIDTIDVKCSDDIDNIAEKIIRGCTVCLNFSKCPNEDAKKVFDYVSGVCISLDGDINKEDKDLYMFMPKLMEYQGMLIDELCGEYEDK